MSNFTWYLAVIFVVLFLILYLHYINISKRQPMEQKTDGQSILQSLNTALKTE